MKCASLCLAPIRRTRRVRVQDVPVEHQRPPSEAGGLREPDGDASSAARGPGAPESLRPEDCRADGSIVVTTYERRGNCRGEDPLTLMSFLCNRKSSRSWRAWRKTWALLPRRLRRFWRLPSSPAPPPCYALNWTSLWGRWTTSTACPLSTWTSETLILWLPADASGS